MNYIKTINQFWRIRRSKRITSLQTDLYFFLLHESSSRGSGDNWENPFSISNGVVCTSIGISEKALIDARNVLKQLGLIDFENGITKQKAPVYYLLEYLPTVSNPVSITVGIAGGNPVSNQVGNEGNNIKDKRNGNGKRSQTKQSSGGKAPGEKSDEVLYWKKIVNAWFEFYKQRYAIEPTFNAAAAKNLKSIVDRLKKLNEKAPQPQEWSEEYALRIFNHFLTKAWADPWLSDNFLLNNLYSKFDKIISNGKGTNAAQATAGQKFGSNADPNDYRGGFAAGMG